MSETCHPGIAYILQLYTEEQSRVDTALTHSVCHMSKEDGMRGMELPYQLRSDWMVTCVLFLCFILVSYVLAHGKKHLEQQFKNFALSKERASLFDDTTASYVRGNFYNRGRVATESLRASDDLIFLNVHPNKDGSLSFENPRVFQGKGVTTWEGLIKSVRAKVKGTKVKIRLGASSGEWKAMVADEAARTTFAKNIKTVLEKNKLDGIDLDFEWAENEKEYEDYSLAILKMREVLGDKYLFSVSLHPVCYKISKEAIEAVDFISLQCYGPSPVRFPIEKYCSDIQMVLEYGIPREKLVAGVPFYGVTKDNSKKTEAYFNFVQNGLVTSPAQNEVIYQGDTYVFDGQDNIRIKTRYAKEQKLKGMMSWDLATDLPLSDSRSLLKTMTEELRE